MRRVTWMVIAAGSSALVAGCGGSSDDKASGPVASTPAVVSTPVETMTEEAATTETTSTPAAKASPNSTKRPDTDGDGSPDVQTFRGKIGDSFTLVGQPGFKKPAKDAVKVTVLGLTGPFSGFDLGKGRKLIGLKVRFEGVGSKRYDDAQPSGQLTLSSGESGKPTSLITAGNSPCDNPSLKLKKGDSVTECLAFDIPKNAKPRVFEYATDSGFGDTGVWRLR